MKSHTGANGTCEWFVVDEENDPNYPTGPCFISLYADQRVGHIFGLTGGCVRIPPSKVPQYVWVELAKFRLTR